MRTCRRPGCDGAPDIAGEGPYCSGCAPAAVGAVSPDGFLGPAATGVTMSGAPAGGVAVPDPRLPRDRSFLGASRTLGSHRSVPGRMPRSGVPARSGPVRRGSASGSVPGRGRLGAGLVAVPEVPRSDPRAAVLADPRVPEHKRFCGRADCGARVGRSRGGSPSRPEGFCTRCGHPYSFVPKLRAGDLVHGQYEVVGCLAHGGQGWIHLAVDHAVSDRWVVLKGPLGTADDALAVAVAELRHLAGVEHPNIVRIHNFVEHPDPRTGGTDGYVVMEYIGGRSLKEIANERTTTGGRRDPLPVEQACAYGLEALDALAYLHSRNLLYCDFKPDNAIQQQDRLKLIDMGAVRRIDDTGGPVYGTAGYQAPEVAAHGPSVASDLYTVARTIAVLVFDFQGFTTVYADSLPPPEHIDVFTAYESLYRFLVRATDPDPTRRFASAEEMAEQLAGVLREVVALRTGQPRPALSALFGPEPRCPAAGPFPVPGAWRPDGGARAALAPLAPAATALALPVPRPDPDDPCAGFLAGLAASAPADLLAALGSAPADSAERRMREVRALLETGNPHAAAGVLKAAEAANAGDWRVIWYRGVVALTAGDTEAAAWAFDAVYDAFPGETAPRLALAVCAELLGQTDNAAAYYRSVWTTDPGFVSAAFGLARVRLALGDRAGAVLALESVPETSVHSTAARVAAVRARLAGNGTGPAGPADLVAAAWQVERLRETGLDAVCREQLTVEVLTAALARVLAPGAHREQDGISGAPGGNRQGVGTSLLGSRPNERDLRLGLERSYRALARLARHGEERIDLVERANRCRPRTWV